MTWTKNGYRYAPCSVCLVGIKMGIRDQVKAGRCHIRGVGDTCAYHFHVLMEAFKDE